MGTNTCRWVTGFKCSNTCTYPGMVLQGQSASCASAWSTFTVCWLSALFWFMFYLDITGDHPLEAVTQGIFLLTSLKHVTALFPIYVPANYIKLFCLLALHREQQALISCWSKIPIGVIGFVYSFIWPA